MFLSKIWFILVGLLAGLSLTAAFVAPRPADRRIEQLEGQRLDRAQYAAEQMLKTDAHRWIDYVAKLGRDAVIAESLDSASRGAGEARLLHETVKNRLRVLVPDLPGIGLDCIVAVDNKGRVVARAGDREGDYGDAINGAEVVAEALRGVLSDDVWGVGGKLRRIAAAPVLTKTRDRIIGAIYVGADTGKRLTDLWKKNLGVEVAVLLQKQVLSSTLPESVLSELPGLIENNKAEMAEAKRTRALILPVGSDRLLAVAAPFTGQASQQDAYYVLIGKKAVASNPWALLSSTTLEDLSNFPWLALGGGMIALLGIGLLLQQYEVEGPLLRLRKELRRVADGDLHKIDDTSFHGKFGGIARDVNAAIERFTHDLPVQRSEASRSDLSRKDFNAILDSGARDSAPFELVSPPPLVPPPSLGLAPPPPPAAAFGPSAPPSDPWKAPPLASPPAPPPAAFGRAERPAPQPAPVADAARTPQPQPRLVAPAPPTTVVAPSRPVAPIADSPPRPAMPFPAAPSVSDLEPAVPAPRFPGTVESAESAPVAPSGAARAVAQDAASRPPTDDKTAIPDLLDPEEAHLREVFADYVAARRETGESIASLTLEKFRAKLETNRQQLVSKYNCRTARFSVYIKDGKAAIKATPVRD